jgi:hypothetical protein
MLLAAEVCDARPSFSGATMRYRWITFAALLAAPVPAAEMRAERAPEERDKATHVIVGKVAGVYRCRGPGGAWASFGRCQRVGWGRLLRRRQE